MPKSSGVAEHLIEVVKRAVDGVDPEGLLRMGAPANEYDQEVGLIAARINSLTDRSAEKVEAVVAGVWREQFTHFVADHPEKYHAMFKRLAAAIVTGLRAEASPG